MEEIKEPSFWERLKDRLSEACRSVFTFIGTAYFCSAMLMGTYYSCTDKEASSPQYQMWRGAVWPYHVFINPQWKKDRAEMTWRLGIVMGLLFVTENPKTEAFIHEESKKIIDWVDDLPDSEKNDLEKASIAYFIFVTEYYKKFNKQMLALEGIEVKIDGKLKLLSKDFSNFPGFMNAFNDQLEKDKPILREVYFSLIRTLYEYSDEAPLVDSQTGLPIGMKKESAKQFLESEEYQEYLEKVTRPKLRARMESGRVAQNIFLEKLFSKPSLLPDTP